MRYLLVTHIPFRRSGNGLVEVDALWGRDLRATARALGRIRIAAPEIRGSLAGSTWGTGLAEVRPDEGIDFSGLPVLRSRRDFGRQLALRAALRREVNAADIVHTSNYFPPYTGLAYAHRFATRIGRRTVFVIAEDFYDMLEWEWVRTAAGRFQRWRRERMLRSLDRRTRLCASTASITFLHTPAAVDRYRSCTLNGVAIRQPAHEKEDVIGGEAFGRKCRRVTAGGPLVLSAACRHSPLKGIDLLIRAVAILAGREIPVEVRVYGSGAQTESWKQLALSLKVHDRVSFPGALPPGVELQIALQNTDLFMMPHRTTDFGRAFFDAMAAACPVIAFRSAASASTVRDGVDGLLCPMDDFEGLADAITRFDRDRDFLLKAVRSARERGERNTATVWHGIRAAHIRELVPSSGEPGE
jgi:glycosyltransferase involved in cell wall biosynthesis